MGTMSELLCPVTAAKAWGWKDLLPGSRSLGIFPFWLLIPLPEIPPVHQQPQGTGKKGCQRLA